MTDPIFEISNLTCGYGSQAIVKGVSLEIVSGSLVGLVGPNGHGKSTLLRAISGLIKIIEGTILLDGSIISGLSADKIVEKGIIHIPQGDMIFTELSVHENLLMGAYLPKAYSERLERLEFVSELFPILSARRNQIASGLSGGERRMLGVGRALMSTSRVLLIDEPSLGLAPIIIDQIYEVIHSLKESGRTILIVEENASRLMDLSDKICLLDDGHFVWEGDASDLMNNDVLMETYLGG
ncbi:ATP-binding cassette domain-containing protein [Rhodobacteraceae bacterium Araon29]